MAVTNDISDSALLQKPTDTPYESLTRTPCVYNPLATYTLPRGEGRHYQQQYADMYFARLAQLKPSLVRLATEAFQDYEIGGEQAKRVDRVLDVRQGNLCWVVGTIYMEMPLKPNVLDDIGKEHWIAAPPAREKYNGGEGQVMLEDESGRLRLTGGFLGSVVLVTGAIVAVLGTENSDGDFEVIDVQVPDLPRQPARWERDEGDAALQGKKVTQKREKAGKVAIVSGLSISGDAGDTLLLDLLAEYLLGEATSPSDQEQASQISRLVIAGNSLAHGQPIPSREDVIAAKKTGKRTYGYDASAYNAAPTDRLDSYLASLLPSIPITLLPGATDPTSTSLPQQPIHAAMFPHCRPYMPQAQDSTAGWFDSVTNPAEFDLDGFRFLGGGGQTLDDVYKYLDGEDRLEMMESMLRWRLSAPTAPDTLPCYPFQDGDRFVMKECPHVYFVGNQPRFETSVIEGPQGQKVRMVTVPSFSKTGEVVLLDLEDLKVEIIKFEAFEEE
ncbi:DNA polymerase delta subunit 2 [Sphaerulina musiva SO2202]|uniref:DNA-directed DNA polymerase n=1 Tax=Sphaerulina musiva (strain SO2202) TaxID=692275 RepID=M3AVM7_SPHMS|nr:DNA polymerase delta subunit 2 [Sphaerulina musiva SO2202]EMF10121.1 DNA polymerase delta subunit 2 [Sphaerulina musiva SO2202]